MGRIGDCHYIDIKLSMPSFIPFRERTAHYAQFFNMVSGVRKSCKKKCYVCQSPGCHDLSGYDIDISAQHQGFGQWFIGMKPTAQDR